VHVCSEDFLEQFVLTDVYVAVAKRPEQCFEYSLGIRVILAQERACAAAKVLVHLRGIGPSDSNGRRAESEHSGDLVVGNGWQRPFCAAARGTLDQGPENTAVRALVEFKHHIANEGTQIVNRKSAERFVEIGSVRLRRGSRLRHTWLRPK
jgi:hypothetical protein